MELKKNTGNTSGSREKSSEAKRASAGLKALYRKELADHLTSKRFLIILILIYATSFASLYGALSGLSDAISNDTNFIFLKLYTTSGNSIPSFMSFIALLGPFVGLTLGFDAINIVRLFDFFKQDYSLLEKIYMKAMRIIFKRGRIVDYARAAKYFTGIEDRETDCYPTIIPNWDHSPRSGRKGHILIHSTPEKFKKHILQTFANVIHKPEDKRIVFLKSWNEWAEGNYMEPDLKFGLSYLEALKEALDENIERK